MKLIRVALTFMLTGIAINYIEAQKTSELYMTKEIKQAYDKGYRTVDGIPGPNYFINRADYKITAEFDPMTRILRGEETITYTNNSPDTLKVLYFNLYQDLFKKGNRRDWDIGPVDITDGVQILKIAVNAIDIDLNSNNIRNSSSILRIIPDKPILPGTTATINIKWSFVLPGRVPIRMGTYGGDNFFIAYWFPKICVYDDISGWNTNGHSGNDEFYNDFGDYEVNITVPGAYSVWSTGLLQNEEDLYEKKILDRIKAAGQSDEVISIISKIDRVEGSILKKGDKHTWQFKSEHTPDFAFAVSKSYLWDGCSYQSGERRVPIYAVYNPESKDFHDVAYFSRASVVFFTEQIPGIPYPYPQLTAFNGGGGMEFPGMVNDGDAENRNGTLYVTSHEIGHSYFPFFTGLNEQKYAWMDEGLITFFPQFVIEMMTNDSDYVFFANNIRSYNYYAGTFSDVPLMTSSDNVGRNAYRFHAYARSSISFYLLYQYLGREKFVDGLQLFSKNWTGKHPIPYDLFYTFNNISGEDLAWFWQPWFFEFGYADLSIGKVDPTDHKEVIVHISNRTGFPVPVKLNAIYQDGSERLFEFPMSVWKDGKKELTVNVKDKGLKKIMLDVIQTPDAFPNDNSYAL